MSFLRPLLLLSLALSATAAEWSTYRGNAQRSGCTDGKAGPAAAKVLWVLKSNDHFVAAPVPHGDRLFVSGLGFVNTSTLYALHIDPGARRRVAWTQSAPLIARATVSSPAVSAGRLILGEGMHQTNGASLYGFDPVRGAPLWQRYFDGDLVHLEGGPTVADGRVFTGGGAAGVVCLDPARLTLGGKEMSAAAIAKAIAAKRAELQKKYEQARKDNDPFAVPPTERDLPRPAPLLVWQAGKGKWHVDAPVAVVGGKVLAASAFLDKEQVGHRALLCLDAKTGKELWQAALPLNPWGGPAVAGKVVVVTGGSVTSDPAALAGARGGVWAFDLDTGKPLWKKELPGGVLACAALTKDLALVPATDGRVRAYALAGGALRWTYSGGAAFFAPVALGPDTAYAADLKGVVHAVNLRSGAARWKLDLAAAPEVRAPGMVYGGPALAGGRLFVATCNLAGDHAKRPTVVVCIGDK